MLPLLQCFYACCADKLSFPLLTVGGDPPPASDDPPRTDYELQEFFFNRIRTQLIDDFHRRVCYNQTVYDDLRLEATEYAGLTLEVQDLESLGGPTTINTVVDINHAAFRIIDNDSKLSFLIRELVIP